MAQKWFKSMGGPHHLLKTNGVPLFGAFFSASFERRRWWREGGGRGFKKGGSSGTTVRQKKKIQCFGGQLLKGPFFALSRLVLCTQSDIWLYRGI